MPGTKNQKIKLIFQNLIFYKEQMQFLTENYEIYELNLKSDGTYDKIKLELPLIKFMASAYGSYVYIDIDGNVYVKGKNTDGKFGLGYYEDVVSFTKIPNIEPIKKVCISERHIVYLGESGKAYVCGNLTYSKKSRVYENWNGWTDKSKTLHKVRGFKEKIIDIETLENIVCFLDCAGNLYVTGNLYDMGASSHTGTAIGNYPSLQVGLPPINKISAFRSVLFFTDRDNNLYCSGRLIVFGGYGWVDGNEIYQYDEEYPKNKLLIKYFKLFNSSENIIDIVAFDAMCVVITGSGTFLCKNEDNMKFTTQPIENRIIGGIVSDCKLLLIAENQDLYELSNNELKYLTNAPNITSNITYDISQNYKIKKAL